MQLIAYLIDRWDIWSEPSLKQNETGTSRTYVGPSKAGLGFLTEEAFKERRHDKPKRKDPESPRRRLRRELRAQERRLRVLWMRLPM